MFLKKKNPSSTNIVDGEMIDIQWGGYYASKEEGKFVVFRLLDFNKDAYHAQLFQEKFDRLPNFAEVKDLKPFIWHVPIAIGGLLDREKLKLIGQTNLDEQALMGYEQYLRQIGAEEPATKEMVSRIIAFSTKAPMRVKLSKSADKVTVTPIE